jgi:hypothetical protein
VPFEKLHGSLMRFGCLPHLERSDCAAFRFSRSSCASKAGTLPTQASEPFFVPELLSFRERVRGFAAGLVVFLGVPGDHSADSAVNSFTAEFNEKTRSTQSKAVARDTQ